MSAQSRSVIPSSVDLALAKCCFALSLRLAWRTVDRTKPGLAKFPVFCSRPMKRSIPGLSANNRGLIIDFGAGIPTP